MQADYHALDEARQFDTLFARFLCYPRRSPRLIHQVVLTTAVQTIEQDDVSYFCEVEGPESLAESGMLLTHCVIKRVAFLLKATLFWQAFGIENLRTCHRLRRWRLNG